MKLSAAERRALETLFELWVRDNAVALALEQWIVIGKALGREEEAREAAYLRDE